MKETEYIMKSLAMMDIIRKGDEEIKSGGGVKIELESLNHLNMNYQVSGPEESIQSIE